MTKHKHIFDQVPLSNYKIDASVHDVFLDTKVKLFRYAIICQQMTGKPVKIVKTKTLKPFIQYLN